MRILRTIEPGEVCQLQGKEMGEATISIDPEIQLVDWTGPYGGEKPLHSHDECKPDIPLESKSFEPNKLSDLGSAPHTYIFDLFLRATRQPQCLPKYLSNSTIGMWIPFFFWTGEWAG
jgi:hypothetical protein